VSAKRLRVIDSAFTSSAKSMRRFALTLDRTGWPGQAAVLRNLARDVERHGKAHVRLMGGGHG
jgi:hypothetical protein